MKEAEINRFLTDFRELILRDEFFIVKRDKNIEGLEDLNLTKELAQEEIFELTYKNYSKGPESDDSDTGEIWIFGKEIAERTAYIKLKISEKAGKRMAKCISIHPAFSSMKFPFK